MTGQRRLTVVIGTFGTVAALMLVGCFRLRTGCGTVLYEAKTPEAVKALNSRIEPLRMTLRNDPRFVEVTKHRTLDFVGATNTEFEGCWIGYNRDEKNVEKDRRAILVVSSTRTFSFAKQVRRLRHVIDPLMGQDVMRQLNVSFDERLIDVR